jgi:hypothetical protein
MKNNGIGNKHEIKEKQWEYLMKRFSNIKVENSLTKEQQHMLMKRQNMSE